MRKTVIGPDVGSDLDMFDGVAGVSSLPHSEAVAVHLPEYTRLFISGTGPISDEGTVVAPGDPETQLRVILETIEEILDLVEGEISDIVRLNLITEELSDQEYLDICRVRESFLAEGHEPASTMTESDQVGIEGMCLEADADAVIPGDEWELEHLDR